MGNPIRLAEDTVQASSEYESLLTPVEGGLSEAEHVVFYQGKRQRRLEGIAWSTSQKAYVLRQFAQNQEEITQGIRPIVQVYRRKG